MAGFHLRLLHADCDAIDRAVRCLFKHYHCGRWNVLLRRKEE